MTAQKENGFTAIANELMEALIKYPLPGAQMQCLLLILRKTYGFNKKQDSISLSQFQEHTGISRRNVVRALKQLQSKNIIKAQKGGVKNDTILTSKYMFNKDYSTWKSGVIIDTGSVKRGKKVVSNMTHTKDNTKESIVQNKNDFYLTAKKRKLSGKRLETFDIFWDKFNYKKGNPSAADSWLNIPTLTDKLVNEIYIAAENEAKRRPDMEKKNQTPKMAQGWLTDRRWEDEHTQEPKKTIVEFPHLATE